MMTVEANDVVRRAREWLNVTDAARVYSWIRDGFSDQTGLLELSSRLAELSAKTASDAVLGEVGLLFDQLAERPIDNDVFGERYEVAGTLAYLGWRNSYYLGREDEALRWVDVADCIANEEVTEFHRLECFLYLPEGSAGRYDVFLPSGLDVFWALTVLRRDRLRRPLEVIAAAKGIYRWLGGTGPKSVSAEEAYFRTEAAYLAASGLRMLGRLGDCRPWFATAKKERRGMICQSVVRVRLQLLTLLINREDHRYRCLLPRFAKVIQHCYRLGLYREMLVARFAEAMVERVLGRDAACIKKLDALRQESQDTVYASITGVCFGQISGMLARRGLVVEAEAGFSEALDRIPPAEDRLSFASVLMQIGDAQLSYGRPAVAARLFRLASEHFSRIGSWHYQALSEVLAAEAFVDAGSSRDAMKALAIAFPLIKRESMSAEGVHALKILNTIVSRGDSRYGRLEELLAELQRGSD
jgi:hypothetical protein